MNNLVKNVLILVLILVGAGVAWKLAIFLVKWILIGGGIYVGYRLFFSKNKQIEQ